MTATTTAMTHEHAAAAERDADDIAACFRATMRSSARTLLVDDEWYILTSGTGDGDFAYRVDDARDALAEVSAAAEVDTDRKNAAYAADEDCDSDFSPYTVFCGEATPVEDTAVAWAAYDEGVTIDRDGSCMPVLDEGARAHVAVHARWTEQREWDEEWARREAAKAVGAAR